MKFIIALTFIGVVLLSLAGDGDARPHSHSKGDEEFPLVVPDMEQPHVFFESNGIIVTVSQNPEPAPVGEPNYTVVSSYTFTTPDEIEVPAVAFGFDTNGVVASASGNPAETPVGQPSTTVSASSTYELPDGSEIQVSSTFTADEIGFQLQPEAGQASPTVGGGYTIVEPDGSSHYIDTRDGLLLNPKVKLGGLNVV